MNLIYNLIPTYLLATGTTTGEETGGLQGMLAMLLPFALIIGFMYFFSIRPQKKKEKELKAKLDSMRPGDNVMTIGGIVGRVANISGDEVTIYTSVSNTMMTFKKNAISTVLSPSSSYDEEETD
ncbi:MAG: preprotein translocase subunit YajC [Eubacteriales bacterium]|nr:preprotein translocase subunit YajC [Eubacteriales bacterium]MDD4540589.1 preprotein translocase subunit YajC [Eubacteriales bacterium]